jgi:thiamine biosynthesis lipoprotein ApbE
MTADGLATALCILGPGRGMALVKKRAGVAAILVPRRPGEPIESPRFRNLRQHRNSP